MQTIGPNDVVLITRITSYSFAFNYDLPVRLQARPELDIGFQPLFRDTRLHTVTLLTKSMRQEIDRAVKPAERVFVFEHNPDLTGYQPHRTDLVEELNRQGFVQEKVTLVNRAAISVYRRK